MRRDEAETSATPLAKSSDADRGDGSGSELLAEIARRSDVLSKADPAILGGLLHVVHTLVVRSGSEALSECDPALIHLVATSLPKATPNRHLLLQLLAMIRSDPSLAMMVEALGTDPPGQWMQAAQILSPLMQQNDWSIEAVFPHAFECLQYPSLAAPLLDLANYVTRSGRVERHPGAEHLPMLNRLLGEVSNRLSLFEDDPRTFGNDIDSVQARLGEAIALAVSLCDAVGLIGDESSIGKLNQTVDLKHRRVQCEAAGALAKLGDELGKKRILDLVSDPSARLRAIRYADELDFGDLVDEQYRSENATAEAELSLWLCQPQQMGVPPTGVEVIDSRRMLWPSFNDPIDVHLVRFEYNFGEKQYSNVGITGPVTFALSADVAELPIDDIYSIYAGWHAEHDGIFTVAVEQFNDAQSRAIDAFTKHLVELGYESVKPDLLGLFLDERAGVFHAVRDATACVVVTDGLETFDQTVAGRQRPLSASDLFNLYKGRKMLRTFNP